MQVNTDRKGVSPLIAAVLLIAFTMAVAAILTAWVTTFTQEQTQAIGNESERQIQCSYGNLEILEATYDSTNGVTNVVVANTGQVNFDNVTVTGLQAGQRADFTVVGAGGSNPAVLNQGITKSAQLTGQMDSVRVSSIDCPAVTVSSTVS